MAAVSSFHVALVASTARFSGPLRAAERQWERFSRQVIRDSAALPEAMQQATAASLAFGRSLLRTTAILAPIVAGTTGWAIKLASDFEQTRLALTNLLGDAEEADKLLAKLERTAKDTSLGFGELLSAAKQLIVWQFTREEIEGMIDVIADFSAAMGASKDDVDGLILALGQIRGAGVALTQDLRQLIQRGVPVWEIFAEEFGVSVAEAMELVEKRAISADKAIEALLKGLRRRFGGAAVAQMKTVAGQLQKLSDNVNILVRNLGIGVIEGTGLVGVLERLNDRLDRLNQKLSEGRVRTFASNFEGLGGAFSFIGWTIAGFLLPVFKALGKRVLQVYGGIIAFAGTTYRSLIRTSLALGILSYMFKELFVFTKETDSSTLGIFKLLLVYLARVGIMILFITRLIVQSSILTLRFFGTFFKSLNAFADSAEQVDEFLKTMIGHLAKIALQPHWKPVAESAEETAKTGEKAAKSQEELKKSLEEAGEAAGNNLQSFDEVHLIQEEMAKSAEEVAQAIELPEIEPLKMPTPPVAGGQFGTETAREFDEIAQRAIEGWKQVAKEHDKTMVSTLNFWDRLKEKATSVLGGIRDYLVEHAPQLGVPAVVTEAWEGLKSKLASIPSIVSGAWRTFKDSLGDLMSPPSVESWAETETALASTPRSLADIWEALKRKVQGALETLGSAWETMKQKGQGSIGALGPLWDSLREKVAGAASGIPQSLSGLGPAWDALKEAAATAFGAVKGAVESAWGWVEQTTARVWNGVSQAVGSAWAAVKSAVAESASSVAGWVVREWDAIKAKTGDAWEGLKATVTAAWSAAKKTTSETASDVAKWVKEKWALVKAETQDAWGLLESAVGGAWKAAKSATADAAAAIADRVSDRWGAVKTKTQEVWDLLKSLVTGAWNAAKQTTLEVAAGVAGVVRDRWDEIKTKTGDTWDSFKSTLSTAWSAAQTTTLEAAAAIVGKVRSSWAEVKARSEETWEAAKGAVVDAMGVAHQAVTSKGSEILGSLMSAWDWVETETPRTWEAMKGAVAGAINTAHQAVTSRGSEILQALMSAWDWLSTETPKTWDTVKVSAASALDGVWQKASEAWGSLRTETTNTWNSVKSSVSTSLSGVKQGAEEAWSFLKTETPKAWDVVKTAAATARDKIGEFAARLAGLKLDVSEFGKTVDALKTGVVEKFVALANGVKQAVEGLVQGAKKKFVELYNDLVGHSIIPDLVNQILGWFSTLNVQGTALMESFGSNVQAVVAGTAETTLPTFQSWGAAIGQVLGAVLSGSITWGEAFKKAMSSAVDYVRSIVVDRLFDWLDQVLRNALGKVGGFISDVLRQIPGVGNVLGRAVGGVMDFLGKIPVIGGVFRFIGGLFGLAHGGIVTHPIISLLGERGKEAVIPLERADGFLSSLADSLITKMQAAPLPPLGMAALFGKWLGTVSDVLASPASRAVERLRDRGREPAPTVQPSADTIESAVFDGTRLALQMQQAIGQPASSDREVVLQIDGATFARLLLPHLIREGQRRGVQLVFQGA